jgi:hypothetical protein
MTSENTRVERPLLCSPPKRISASFLGCAVSELWRECVGLKQCQEAMKRCGSRVSELLHTGKASRALHWPKDVSASEAHADDASSAGQLEHVTGVWRQLDVR